MNWSRSAFIALALAVAFTASGDFLSQTGGNFKTAREADTSGLPTWPIPAEFKKDGFTFARLRYTAQSDLYGSGHTPDSDRWLIDFPASDLDLSFRLHQMTSLVVDPDGRIVGLKDKELFDYPFIYAVEPGRGFIAEDELPILRKYLLNGGFLMVDDFWGTREWRNFEAEMQRLFPGRPIVDLEIDHPIFHSVFDLKEKPQVPGLPHFRQGRTNERGRDGEEVHYRGIFDDKNRLMVMICHNTDLGDGWEREGENEDYFRQYSEPKAFPMGINIIVYAMTH
jgi:hypothetical protein